MNDETRPVLSKRGRMIAAVVSGLLAAIAMGLYGRSLERRAFGGGLVDVLVLARTLNAGTVLGRGDLLVKPVPKAYLDDRAVARADLEKVLDQKIARPAKMGRFLLWSDLNLDSDEALLSALLKPGRRAFSLPVDNNAAISGLLRPGDRVDVLGTFTRPDAADKERLTLTLLQNVPVLATGDRLTVKEKEGVKGFGTVTLDVDLEEAELLAFAVDRGRVALALRGADDLAIVDGIPDKSFSDLIEAGRRAVLQKRRGASIEELKPKK